MAVSADGNMDSVASGGWSGFLPNQLVKLEVVHHPKEPTFAGFVVRQVGVGCIAVHVVAGFDSSDGCIELWVTKAGAYDNRLVGLQS